MFGLVAEWWPRWGQRWGREHRRATPRVGKYPPAARICHEISWLIGSLGTKQLPTAFRHSIEATPEEESVYADLAKLREIVKDTATKDHLLEYGLYKRFLSSSEALASTITKIRDRVAGTTPGSPSLPLGGTPRGSSVRREAVAHLRQWAEDSVIDSDRKQFVAAAEETLAGIHEGNFARYRIRPSEFEAWKAAWTEPGSTPA
jgi:hypothetical protein